jgi:O-antigen/teichoic acid export membrane protein
MPVVLPDDPRPLDTELDGSLDQQAWHDALWAKTRQSARIVGNFFLGQGAVQAIGILAGLLLARKLSIDSYAQFGLATGFQSVAGILMDLGFASTIIPLVGERTQDLALVGRYVRSAKHLRDRSFLILAPPATLVFVALMHRHHWNWRIQTALVASVLLALYSSGKMSYFSAPLFLYGRLRDYYVPQVVTGASRLGLYLVLGVAGGLNSWTAAGLTALNITANGFLLERRSRPLLTWPAGESPATDREIIDYVMPAAPAAIFAAFQSQISLFLISIFGGTVDVAQVAALGRIGALFSVLMTFNVIVVEPYFARLATARVLRRYALLLAGAAAASTPAVLLAFVRPAIFLWILGPKYAGLQAEIGWLVCGSCINYIAGVIWIMNRARKWLFWSGSILEISLLVGVQTLFVILVGVHNVRQAVFFTFAASFCPLVAHAYVSILGFVKGSRHQVAETA